MTIMPGSLDYLYYQGVLDHIPYEVYDLPYVAPVSESVTPQISGSRLKQMVAGDISVNNGMNNNTGINNYGTGAGINNTGMNNFASNKNTVGRNNSYNSQMNASQYLDYAKQGAIYDAYGSGDYFVNSRNGNMSTLNNDSNVSGFGSVYDLKAQTLGESTNTKRGLFGNKKESKDPILGGSPWKGLLAGALVILTPILILKRIFKK